MFQDSLYWCSRSFNTSVVPLLPSPPSPACSGPPLAQLRSPDGFSLSSLFERLHRAYCGPLAFEFSHVHSEEERRWLAAKAERPYHLTPEERRWLLARLLRAEQLERFLGERFPTSKRFGLEGLEALVPGVEGLVRRAAAHGVSRIEMGMAHRGRINLLCNVLGKPFGQVREGLSFGSSFSSFP
jgi:2-oxoglutarate dehydrogenase complex dehydrogenase (E1) component-like enzyme